MTSKNEEVYHLENTTSKLNGSLNISVTSSAMTPVTLTYNMPAATNFSLTNMSNMGPPPPQSPSHNSNISMAPTMAPMQSSFGKPLKASKMLTDSEYKKAEPVSRIKGISKSCAYSI